MEKMKLSFIYSNLLYSGAPFKFVGGAYHKKSMLIWTAYLWNCMSHDQCDQGHIPQKFEVIFVGFRLLKNIIFNKTKSFVGRNTSDHACQIFCSKGNWDYVSLIFPPRDNRGQNNEQSECWLRPQLFIPTVPV